MNNNAVTIPLECRALPGIQRALYTTMALFCATEKTITQYGELERGQWAGNWRDLVELTDASIHQVRNAAAGLAGKGWLSWQEIKQDRHYMLFNVNLKEQREPSGDAQLCRDMQEKADDSKISESL